MLKFKMMLARALVAAAGDRLLSPPAWTAYVGQRWDTYDLAPWNLYNLLWGLGQWAFCRSEGPDLWRYFVGPEEPGL